MVDTADIASDADPKVEVATSILPLLKRALTLVAHAGVSIGIGLLVGGLAGSVIGTGVGLIWFWGPPFALGAAAWIGDPADWDMPRVLRSGDHGANQSRPARTPPLAMDLPARGSIRSRSSRDAATRKVYPSMRVRCPQTSPPVNGQWDLPSGGQQNCPAMANRTAQRRPGVLPTVQLVSGVTPFPAVAWVRRMLSPAVMTMWAW